MLVVFKLINVVLFLTGSGDGVDSKKGRTISLDPSLMTQAIHFSEEQIRELPKCTFYDENPESCVPDSPYAPCLYCQSQRIQKLVTFQDAYCPSSDSFPEDLRETITWRMTPISTKTSWGSKYFVCVVSPISAGGSGGTARASPAIGQTQLYGGGIGSIMGASRMRAPAVDQTGATDMSRIVGPAVVAIAIIVVLIFVSIFVFRK